MRQLVSLLSLCLFALLAQKTLCVCIGVNDRKYDKAFAVSFFLLFAVAYAEFTFKSVMSGTFFDGELLGFIPAEKGVLASVKKALSSVRGIDDIFLCIGTSGVALATAFSGNIIFYPFIFEAFSGAGLVLLFAVLAFKYEDKIKLFVLFAILATVLELNAVTLFLYMLIRKYTGKETALYIYGAIVLALSAFSGGSILLFAPIFAYLKLSGKAEFAVKTASVALMAYELVLLWR